MNICANLNMRTLIKTPVVRTLPSKSRPHHQHRPNRSHLKDAKIGWLKTRTHPSALHGPLRKKLRCVKFGFTYSKIVPLVTRGGKVDFGMRAPMSGAGDEDYFAKALLDYEAEYRVPFTLCHCWDASINLNVDGGDNEEYESATTNDEALVKLMVFELAMHHERSMEYIQCQKDTMFNMQPYNHLTGDALKQMEDIRTGIKVKWNLPY
nr:hypothetical protein [Tanacetum cinerariifolium]